MKSRSISLILVVLLVLTLLVPVASAEEAVTISFAFWGNNEEIELKGQLAENYMAAHPNVTIEPTFTDGGQYPTKLQTWFAANSAPDVMGIANDILSPFTGLGVFADLKPYMEAEDLLEGTWNPRALEILTGADGFVYAAPFVYKIPAIVYNKTMFDEAGVDYPTGDWTEAQMMELALQFTSGSGRSQVFGMNLGGWPTQMIRNLYGANPVYDPETRTINAADNEEFKAALSMMAKMVAEDKSSPDDLMAQNIGGGFETGRYAMAITAPWEMGPFAKTIGETFEWDIVELPTSEAYGHWAGNLYADGWTISANSAASDAAWDFIKYMTTDAEAQAIVAPIGIPMLTSYATSDEYLSEYYGNKPYDKSVFVGMLDYATGWETAGVWGKVNEEIGNQYKQMLAGKIDIDTAIDNIQTNCTAILAE